MKNDTGEIGVVTNVMGNQATVQLESSGNCLHCRAQFICSPNIPGTRKVVAVNNVKAKVGQTVVVQDLGNFDLLLPFMQFGIPLVGLLLGIFLAALLFPKFTLFNPELFMALIGLMGLIIGGMITFSWARMTSSLSPCFFEVSSILKL